MTASWLNDTLSAARPCRLGGSRRAGRAGRYFAGICAADVATMPWQELTPRAIPMAAGLSVGQRFSILLERFPTKSASPGALRAWPPPQRRLERFPI